MNVQRLISKLCLEPCLWSGDFLKWCVPPTNNSGGVYSLHTWIPHDALLVYVLKVTGFTLIYVPVQNMLYFANPLFNLSNNCPVNTLFMCHFFEEDNYESSSRLLFFDLLYLNSEAMSTTPMERYMKLMSCQEYYQSSVSSLQWCGNENALNKNFIDSLPHQSYQMIAISDVLGDIKIETFSWLKL